MAIPSAPPCAAAPATINANDAPSTAAIPVDFRRMIRLLLHTSSIAAIASASTALPIVRPLAGS